MVKASVAPPGFSWSRKDATKEAQKTTDEWEKRGCPDAPLLDFYMYRAQTDENYSPVNQDMANIGVGTCCLKNLIFVDTC